MIAIEYLFWLGYLEVEYFKLSDNSYVRTSPLCTVLGFCNFTFYLFLEPIQLIDGGKEENYGAH
jgi:hypothetical protein